jgi:hypothetical protein
VWEGSKIEGELNIKAEIPEDSSRPLPKIGTYPPSNVISLMENK